MKQHKRESSCRFEVVHAEKLHNFPCFALLCSHTKNQTSIQMTWSLTISVRLNIKEMHWKDWRSDRWTPACESSASGVCAVFLRSVVECCVLTRGCRRIVSMCEFKLELISIGWEAAGGGIGYKISLLGFISPFSSTGLKSASLQDACLCGPHFLYWWREILWDSLWCHWKDTQKMYSWKSPASIQCSKSCTERESLTKQHRDDSHFCFSVRWNMLCAGGNVSGLFYRRGNYNEKSTSTQDDWFLSCVNRNLNYS